MVKANSITTKRGKMLSNLMSYSRKSIKVAKQKVDRSTQGWTTAPLSEGTIIDKTENKPMNKDEVINKINVDDDAINGEFMASMNTNGIPTSGFVCGELGLTKGTDNIAPINNNNMTHKVMKPQKTKNLRPLEKSPFVFNYTEQCAPINNDVEEKYEVINEVYSPQTTSLDNPSTKLLKSLIGINAGNSYVEKCASISNDVEENFEVITSPDEHEENSNALYLAIAKDQPELAGKITGMILNNEKFSKQLPIFINCPDRRSELVQRAIETLKEDGRYEALMEMSRARAVANLTNPSNVSNNADERDISFDEEEAEVENEMKAFEEQLGRAIKKSEEDGNWTIVTDRNKNTHKGDFSPEEKCSTKVTLTKNSFEALSDDMDDSDISNSEEKHRALAALIISKILTDEKIPREEVDRMCNVVKDEFNSITALTWLENMDQFSMAMTSIRSQMGHQDKVCVTTVSFEVEEDIRRLQLLCNVYPSEVAVIGHENEDEFPLEMRGGGSNTEEVKSKKSKKSKKKKKNKKKMKQGNDSRLTKAQKETVSSDNKKLNKGDKTTAKAAASTSAVPSKETPSKPKTQTQSSLSPHLDRNAGINIIGSSRPPIRGKANENPNIIISSEVSKGIRKIMSNERALIGERQLSKIQCEIQKVQVLITVIHNLAVKNKWVQGNIDEFHLQIAQAFQFYSVTNLIQIIHNIRNLRQRVIHARFAQYSNGESQVSPLGLDQLYDDNEVTDAASGKRKAMFTILRKFLERTTVFGAKEVIPKLLELSDVTIRDLISTRGALMQYIKANFQGIKYDPPVVVRNDMMTLNQPITDTNRGQMVSLPNLALRLNETVVREDSTINNRRGGMEAYIDKEFALFLRSAFPWSHATMLAHYKTLPIKSKWECIFKEGQFIILFRHNYRFLDTGYQPATTPTNNDGNGSNPTNNNVNSNSQQHATTPNSQTNNSGYQYNANNWTNQYSSPNTSTGGTPGYGISPYGPSSASSNRQQNQVNNTNNSNRLFNSTAGTFVPVNLPSTNNQNQDDIVSPKISIYEVIVRRRGMGNNRVNILSNTVFGLEAIQKAVRMNGGYFGILSNTSHLEPTLSKATLLSENNQGQYIFNAKSNYHANEGMATVKVISNIDLTKLIGGSGPVFRNASRRLMEAMTNSNPPCQVQAKSVGDYGYSPTVVAIRSSACHDQERAIAELADHVALDGTVQIGPGDLRIVWEPISVMTPSGPLIVQASVIYAPESKAAQIAEILKKRVTPADPLTNPVTHRWILRDIRPGSPGRIHAINEQRAYYDERIQITIEKVPDIVRLMEDKVIRTNSGDITFEQGITSGQTIAMNNGIAMPSPFTNISKGITRGTYILEGKARDEGIICSTMHHAMMGYLIQIFPHANFNQTIAHIRPMLSQATRDIHNNPLPNITENDPTTVLSPAYVSRSGSTPRHSRTENITGNTPGGTQLSSNNTSESSSHLHQPNNRRRRQARNNRRGGSRGTNRSTTSSISDTRSNLKRKGKIKELEEALQKRNNKLRKLEEQVDTLMKEKAKKKKEMKRRMKQRKKKKKKKARRKKKSKKAEMAPPDNTDSSDDNSSSSSDDNSSSSDDNSSSSNDNSSPNDDNSSSSGDTNPSSPNEPMIDETMANKSAHKEHLENYENSTTPNATLFKEMGSAAYGTLEETIAEIDEIPANDDNDEWYNASFSDHDEEGDVEAANTSQWTANDPELSFSDEQDLEASKSIESKKEVTNDKEGDDNSGSSDSSDSDSSSSDSSNSDSSSSDSSSDDSRSKFAYGEPEELKSWDVVLYDWWKLQGTAPMAGATPDEIAMSNSIATAQSEYDKSLDDTTSKSVETAQREYDKNLETYNMAKDVSGVDDETIEFFKDRRKMHEMKRAFINGEITPPVPLETPMASIPNSPNATIPGKDLSSCYDRSHPNLPTNNDAAGNDDYRSSSDSSSNSDSSSSSSDSSSDNSSSSNDSGQSKIPPEVIIASDEQMKIEQQRSKSQSAKSSSSESESTDNSSDSDSPSDDESAVPKLLSPGEKSDDEDSVAREPQPRYSESKDDNSSSGTSSSKSSNSSIVEMVQQPIEQQSQSPIRPINLNKSRNNNDDNSQSDASDRSGSSSSSSFSILGTKHWSESSQEVQVVGTSKSKTTNAASDESEGESNEEDGSKDYSAKTREEKNEQIKRNLAKAKKAKDALSKAIVGTWTTTQIRQLAAARAKYGNRWTQVAKTVKDKSPRACRGYHERYGIPAAPPTPKRKVKLNDFGFSGKSPTVKAKASPKKKHSPRKTRSQSAKAVAGAKSQSKSSTKKKSTPAAKAKNSVKNKKPVNRSNQKGNDKDKDKKSKKDKG